MCAQDNYLINGVRTQTSEWSRCSRVTVVLVNFLMIVEASNSKKYPYLRISAIIICTRFQEIQHISCGALFSHWTCDETDKSRVLYYTMYIYILYRYTWCVQRSNRNEILLGIVYWYFRCSQTSHRLKINNCSLYIIIGTSKNNAINNNPIALIWIFKRTYHSGTPLRLKCLLVEQQR